MVKYSLSTKLNTEIISVMFLCETEEYEVYNREFSLSFHWTGWHEE